MKAEINERGILELHSETKEEYDKLHYWMQEHNGRIIIPKDRYELAVCRFNNLDIAIFAEPYIEPDLLIGLPDNIKEKLKHRIPNLH